MDSHERGACIRRCGACRRSTSSRASRRPARRLSFTRAAEELFLTQSALSRQVQALEEALGVALFVRRHRALALTPRRRGVPSRGRRSCCGALAAAADAVRGATREPGLTVSTTVSFASLWIIPRLAVVSRALHPDVEVYVSADDRLVDLARGDVDVAVRYLPDASAPAGARAPLRRADAAGGEPRAAASAPARRSSGPPISRGTCCCISTIPSGTHAVARLARRGSRRTGSPDLKPAGSLRFKLYDQVIQAALGGQGVALGRVPLIAELLRDGRLVAPFPKRYDSARGYFAVVAPHARERADVAAFVAWLRDEAAAQERRGDSAPARAGARPRVRAQAAREADGR